MDARAIARGVLFGLTISAAGIGSARAGTVFASVAVGTQEAIHERKTTNTLGSVVEAHFEGEDFQGGTYGAGAIASVVAADTGFALRIYSVASDSDPGTYEGLVSQSAARVTDRLTVRVSIVDPGAITALFALATMRVTGSISQNGDDDVTSVSYAFNGAYGEVHDAGSYNLAIRGRSQVRQLELGVYEFDIDARLSSFNISMEGSSGYIVNFGNSAELIDLRFEDQDGREVPVEITSELGLNYNFAVPEPGSFGTGMVGLGIVALAARKRWVGAAKRR